MKFQVSPSTSLSGSHRVASDKSISHRSVMLGALAAGTTTIRNILEGEDVLATIRAFRQMGIEIEREGVDEGMSVYRVHGKGLHGLEQPAQALDMGNSGTAFRLLSGILGAQPWSSELTGDESLVRRPMGRIIDPLESMGARVVSNGGFPPLGFSPPSELTGIHYHSPVASAQVKSAILLAGMYAQGETRVTEPGVTRDHTERMLRGFGYDVTVQGSSVALVGGGSLECREIEVPSDLSSAAFFILAALICPGSEITLTSVGNNPSRNGVLAIFRRMGAEITLLNEREIGGEPVADIRVSSSNLQGCEIQGADIALAIDEIPAIAVAAAVASGETVIRDAAELRVKESDRISSTVRGLSALGVDVLETEDGMVIQGGVLDGGEVDSHGDHRIAMAFAVAGAAARSPVVVHNCRNVATSFPEFTSLAAQAGIDIKTSEQE